MHMGLAGPVGALCPGKLIPGLERTPFFLRVAVLIVCRSWSRPHFALPAYNAVVSSRSAYSQSQMYQKAVSNQTRIMISFMDVRTSGPRVAAKTRRRLLMQLAEFCVCQDVKCTPLSLYKCGCITEDRSKRIAIEGCLTTA